MHTAVVWFEGFGSVMLYDQTATERTTILSTFLTFWEQEFPGGWLRIWKKKKKSAKCELPQKQDQKKKAKSEVGYGSQRFFRRYATYRFDELSAPSPFKQVHNPRHDHIFVNETRRDEGEKANQSPQTNAWFHRYHKFWFWFIVI